MMLMTHQVNEGGGGSPVVPGVPDHPAWPVTIIVTMTMAMAMAMKNKMKMTSTGMISETKHLNTLVI